MLPNSLKKMPASSTKNKTKWKKQQKQQQQKKAETAFTVTKTSFPTLNEARS